MALVLLVALFSLFFCCMHEVDIVFVVSARVYLGLLQVNECLGWAPLFRVFEPLLGPSQSISAQAL